MLKSDTIKENKHDFLQFVVFMLADQEFGINVLDSREIITAGEITKIPDSPGFVSGVINLRNEIIPIVDLAKRFNIDNKLSQEAKVIIISVNDTLIGLCVNEVCEIQRINTEDISKVPEITQNIKQKYIQGIARLDDRLLILLDINSIFSREEIEKIKDIEIN